MKLNLQEDIDRTKNLINIVNLSDLRDSGTWDPKTMTQKKEGRNKYYFENDRFVETPSSKSSKLYYLTPNMFEILNNMIHKTQEKYMEYLNQKEITDTLIHNYTSDKLNYRKQKKGDE
jgi:hypothetical protein